ncbi:MAG TPA: hypothetical protein VM840_11095, partial [Actinomycetota bacterium]|nr:hypothetical protein [Actinomycetota bacterium]
AVVLGVPDASLSTPDVYRRLDELGAVRAPHLHHNDLEAAAVSLEPRIAEGLEALRLAGADPVFVSGSGPVVAGIVSELGAADAVAERARPAFRRVIVTEPVAYGVRMTIGTRR